MPYDTSEAFHKLKALVLSTKPLNFIDAGEEEERELSPRHRCLLATAPCHGPNFDGEKVCNVKC